MIREAQTVSDAEASATWTIALVGNPNVGKSVIFGKLTGAYVTVSNYPGTTVDILRGTGRINGRQMQVVDTPGILSLFPRSDDERVTRDLLLQKTPQAVIQVADAKNLRRSLLITLELSELKIPMVLALNMSDEARERGIEIDRKRLSEILGVPVVETTATTGEGMSSLKRAISEARIPVIRTQYLAEVTEAYSHVSSILASEMSRLKNGHISEDVRQFIAQTLLHGDSSVWQLLDSLIDGSSDILRSHCEPEIEKIKKRFVRPISLLSLASRQQKAGEIASEIIRVTGMIYSSYAQTFGRLAMRPWPGYLIGGIVLFIMYEFVGVFAAQFLVGLLENRRQNKTVDFGDSFKFKSGMNFFYYFFFLRNFSFSLL